jgi:hypothetical protein
LVNEVGAWRRPGYSIALCGSDSRQPLGVITV